MSDAAPRQLDRIVQLVAELSRRADAGDGQTSWTELAACFGVPEDQLQEDVRTLTLASDEPDVEWLSSLRITQERDGIQLWSGGPFRRPMRFTPAELAAILIGLAWDGDELPAFARELARVGAAEADSPRQHHVAPAAGPGEAAVVRLAHQAIEERRVLTIKYAGAADRLGTDRAIEPHDVVAAQGRFYIVAWCRKKGAWRTFRADRVLDALLEEMRFSPRDDFRPPCAPEDVFRTADEPDGVRVRFSRAIARWLRERHPDAEPAGDGSAVVTYRVADPAWLVGTVLQYGAEAEVVEPAEWRAVMGRALGVRG